MKARERGEGSSWSEGVVAMVAVFADVVSVH